MIVPDPPGALPFVPLREHLYSQDELTVRTPPASPGDDPAGDRPTVDEAIGAWFHGPGHGVDFAIARALHDATIDSALVTHLAGRSVVGVMGGHADTRGSDRYVTGARLGRALSRAGYHVATGGGPGLMEAANLGAWFAPAPDADLDTALEILDAAPSYEADPIAYTEPWSFTLHFRLMADTELIEDVCDNEKDGAHLVGHTAADDRKIGIDVSSQILSQYVGSYELKNPGAPSTLMQISMAGGRLILSGSELTPISETEFTGTYGNVKFRKDAQGRVTGMLVAWSTGDEDELARK